MSAAAPSPAPAAPSPDVVLPYVRAAAALLGLPLDADRAQRVAAHLGRTAAMAQLLDAAPLGPEDEPAALYCPAPFPCSPEALQPAPDKDGKL